MSKHKIWKVKKNSYPKVKKKKKDNTCIFVKLSSIFWTLPSLPHSEPTSESKWALFLTHFKLRKLPLLAHLGTCCYLCSTAPPTPLPTSFLFVVDKWSGGVDSWSIHAVLPLSPTTLYSSRLFNYSSLSLDYRLLDHIHLGSFHSPSSISDSG